jgi:hypothetical protein
MLHFHITSGDQFYRISNGKVSTALTWELTTLGNGEMQKYSPVNKCLYINNYLMIDYALSDSPTSADNHFYTYIKTPNGKTYNLKHNSGGFLYDDLTKHEYIKPLPLIGKNEIAYHFGDTIHIVKLKKQF